MAHKGKRYKKEVLEIRYNDRSIDEVLDAALDGGARPKKDRQVNLKVASSRSQARVSPPRS